MELWKSHPELAVIAAILAIAAILEVLEATGLMPERVARFIARNKSRPVLNVLRELGVDVDAVKRTNLARTIPKTSSHARGSDRVREALPQLVVATDVEVGSVSRVRSSRFIDLMGASTSPGQARLFAALLAEHWRSLVEAADGPSDPEFDFIVTPKRGSPILGYEFAQLLNRPLALHVQEPKFETTDQANPFAKFDFYARPQAGARALIVDDSTTGGDKVVRAARDLRAHGFVVSDCLVVFEPTVKSARSVLEQNGIRLYSMTRLPRDP